MPDKIQKTEDEWRQDLTPEEYRMLRESGMEAPFTGEYWNMHEQGMYACRACGAQLFSSHTKFDSGTGWPSFAAPMNLEHIELVEDLSHSLRRMEVKCKRCGSHLGHVFTDVPGKSGLRYCINSACLRFKLK